MVYIILASVELVYAQQQGVPYVVFGQIQRADVSARLTVARDRDSKCKLVVNFIESAGAILKLRRVDGYDIHYLFLDGQLTQVVHVAADADASINYPSKASSFQFLFVHAVSSEGETLSARFHLDQSFSVCPSSRLDDTEWVNEDQGSISLWVDDSTPVFAMQKAKISASVLENGDPERDLQAVFGQPAFVALFDKENLTMLESRVLPMSPTDIEVATHAGHDVDDIPGVDGIHFHNGIRVYPFFSIHSYIPRSGTYVGFVEFGVRGQLLTRRFTLVAR